MGKHILTMQLCFLYNYHIRKQEVVPLHYVMADIHGNERRFNSVMNQIRLTPEDTLYVLGDVVDRHPGGLRILRRLMAMPNVKMILGNHEYMMLRALGYPRDDNVDDGRAMDHWYRNGGKVTLDYYKRIRKTLRQEIIAYLHRLPLNLDAEVAGKRYKLVHGAPMEEYDGSEKYKNPIYFSIWKRLNADYAVPGDYTLIFGHTPTQYYRDVAPMEVWYADRMIGIDCGSGYPEQGEDSQYGRLACLRLEDGNVFYSEENHENL